LIIGEKTVRHISNNYLIPQSYIVKFNRQGSIIWERSYGDSIFSNFTYSVREDPFGNLYMASNWDLPKLLKIDSYGNVLWQKTYEVPIIDFAGLQFIDNFKNLLIVGRNDTNGYLTTSLTKIDTSGILLWTKSYADDYYFATPSNGLLCSKEGYYLIGNRVGAPSNFGFYLCTDTSGSIRWKKYISHRVGFVSLCQNSERTFIATGNRSDLGGLYCLKFDIFGDTLWQRSYVLDSLETGYSIIKTLKNNFAIATAGYEGKGKFVIIDSLSNILNTYVQHYSQNDNVSYQSISNAADSGFFISGYIEPNNMGSVDILAVKTDKFGNTTPIGITNESEPASEFALDLVSYPNPFNSNTIIEVKYAGKNFLKIELYNSIGQYIATLFANYVSNAIRFSFMPERYSLSSGIYFLRAVSINSNISVTKRLSYIK